VVTHLAKVERWIAEETKKMPLEDWPTQRKEDLKKLFHTVARFYAEL
jgi:hypothetical protein